jgi:hypothetical protein
MALTRSICLALLVEQAEWSLTVERDRRALLAAKRFAGRPDELPASYEDDDTKALALGSSSAPSPVR